MSINLNVELNAFRAMIVTLKDDIILQRDALVMALVLNVCESEQEIEKPSLAKEILIDGAVHGLSSFIKTKQV